MTVAPDPTAPCRLVLRHSPAARVRAHYSPGLPDRAGQRVRAIVPAVWRAPDRHTPVAMVARTVSRATGRDRTG